MKKEIKNGINQKYFEKYGIAPSNSLVYSNKPNDTLSRLKKTKGIEFVKDLEKLKKNEFFTLQAMGDKYGISRERVRQLFNKAYDEPLSNFRKQKKDDKKESEGEKYLKKFSSPIICSSSEKLKCPNCSQTNMSFSSIIGGRYYKTNEIINRIKFFCKKCETFSILDVIEINNGIYLKHNKESSVRNLGAKQPAECPSKQSPTKPIIHKAYSFAKYDYIPYYRKESRHES